MSDDEDVDPWGTPLWVYRLRADYDTLAAAARELVEAVTPVIAQSYRTSYRPGLDELIQPRVVGAAEALRALLEHTDQEKP